MRAIQHDAIRNFPDLDLVLMPGVEISVTSAQAAVLQTQGITILPDATPPAAIPFPQPPAPALDEEHDR